jgi:hypothetical protein
MFGQLVEQPVRAEQLHALFFGLGQQLFSTLLLIQFYRHELECF